MEIVIPGFPCRNLTETLEFYRAVGFAVTHEQTKPYLYGAVQRGDIQLHFARFHKKQSLGSCLVLVPAVRPYPHGQAAAPHPSLARPDTLSSFRSRRQHSPFH